MLLPRVHLPSSLPATFFPSARPTSSQIVAFDGMPPLHKSPVLPAHETKHLPELEYSFRQHTFRLSQLDNGISNGTALWLGAQCLSVFLAHVYGSKHRTKQSPAAKRPRAIELGSGIGLSAYVPLSNATDPFNFS
ncbi:hypothetical protein NM688_g2750 [Phlebia brevispora]|uniref:Uncharacterized protein n=1 Tax=Phlebia brevispora TaxID=194682 RepID=A0ACC1T7Y2_9APHY|nr:hypothetical protein NM688_g2750 [Phlebia brevispora]